MYKFPLQSFASQMPAPPEGEPRRRLHVGETLGSPAMFGYACGRGKPLPYLPPLWGRWHSEAVTEGGSVLLSSLFFLNLGAGDEQVIQLLLVGPQNVSFCGAPGIKMLGGSEFRLRNSPRSVEFTACRPPRLWRGRGRPEENSVAYSAVSSSILVQAMNRSSSCFWSTTSGQAIIRSEAFCTLGKAMTSRMEGAPAISMHRRSRP